MDGVIEIENSVTRDCRRMVHLMSNRELTRDDLAIYGAPEGTHAQIQQVAGAWHLQAEWPFFGAISIDAEGWPRAKRMVAWSFAGCVNVTEALMQASIHFEHTFGRKPQYGFLRSLPSGVEEGRETGPLMVYSAEWMLERAVVVGG